MNATITFNTDTLIDLPLSDNVRKYMGIVKDGTSDLEEARAEHLSQKYPSHSN